MKKKIVLLGSTGSIGKSFLDILKKDKKNCDILLLSVNRNINELLKQLKIFKVRNIVVKEKKIKSLRYETEACILCEASASLLARKIKLFVRFD